MKCAFQMLGGARNPVRNAELVTGFRTRKETAMRGKRASGMVFVLVLIVICDLTAAAQTGKDVEPISGKQLYSSYCALCHGSDGKGGGPFSPQLKVWPPDLTQLAKKNQIGRAHV